MMTPKRKHFLQSNTDWRIWSKTAILLAMGMYMLFLILTGNLTNYINARFAWLAYIGAAIFFLIGLVNLYVVMKTEPESDMSDYLKPTDNRYNITWGILAIVAFPLLLAVLIPPQPLGASAVSGGISLRPVGVNKAVSLTLAPLDRNILDWLREFDRSQTPAEFNGLPVDVTGFIYREPTFAPEEFMVSRFTISCCVADAFAIGMPTTLENSLSYSDGIWVRIQGKLEAKDFASDFVPVINAELIDVIDPPAQPYLYP